MKYRTYSAFCQGTKFNEYASPYSGGEWKEVEIIESGFEFPQEFQTKKAAWEHYNKHFTKIDSNEYCGYIAD